ncbi:MAG: Fic family protein [Endomicrobium sp.]|jgi:Fic family protein|nr:Fic family protein [Endomicrobium sp.]
MENKYIYQNHDWAHFIWDKEKILILLADVKQKKGIFLGKMESLGLYLQDDANLTIVTENIIKSSEIEGQILNAQAVRSSVAHRLGIEIKDQVFVQKNIDDIVAMMLDALGNYKQELTKERLFGWHAALFSSGYSGFRENAMQVVSGVVGKEKIHYVAPPPEVLDEEVKQFLKWLNDDNSQDLIIKAAIAHLWFVTLHPFDDGNGRIARAITDMVLSRADNTEKRFYSMSAQIQKTKWQYYNILETTQKGSMDVTPWIEWFLKCLFDSIDFSEKILTGILQKHYFWQKMAGMQLNDRQTKIINMIFNRFEGKLTVREWAKRTKTSHDTANRDIAELVKYNILAQQGAGRSTHYVLALDEK